VDVAEVNRLLKQHRQMADAFKAMSRDGGKGIARMAQMMGMGGGMPAGMTPPAGMGGAGGLPGFGGPDLARLKALGAGKLADPNAKIGDLKIPGLPGLPGLGPKK